MNIKEKKNLLSMAVILGVLARCLATTTSEILQLQNNEC
jgi:hypothetical protein